jgi:hypothetical protein
VRSQGCKREIANLISKAPTGLFLLEEIQAGICETMLFPANGPWFPSWPSCSIRLAPESPEWGGRPPTVQRIEKRHYGSTQRSRKPESGSSMMTRTVDTACAWQRRSESDNSGDLARQPPKTIREGSAAELHPALGSMIAWCKAASPSPSRFAFGSSRAAGMCGGCVLADAGVVLPRAHGSQPCLGGWPSSSQSLPPV